MVSIITPCYNSELYISDAIESVISQTYSDWEMIIIDDCSTDKSALIIDEYCKKDCRIKYMKTNSPSGSPTKPRNIGIAEAIGRYIAFLDSDDIWMPDKLMLQMPLFEDPKIAMVYSYYEKIDEKGIGAPRLIKSSLRHSYQSLLYGNEIGCLTVIYDTQKVGKCYFQYIGHEDYALWLSILKKGFIAKGVQASLGYYRIRTSSVSSNKFKVISWIWNIYRKNEKLSFFYSFVYLCSDLTKSFFKFLK